MSTVWINSRALRLLGSGVLALALTTFVSGLWAVLLLTNLRTSPTIPWAVVVMALLLWLMWQYAGGRWWPRKTSHARRAYLRASPVSVRAFTWALVAGAFSLVALTGVWIVLFQSGLMRGNRLPEYSRFPVFTVVPVLVMASLVGALAEEGSFRGYFQVMLEREFSAPAAITITALVIAPGHGMTQGFAWPTFLFYLLVDTMLGVTAYLCNSVWPGVVVHAVGLLVFFTLVWPSDSMRPLAGDAVRDGWFWVHAAQAAVFSVLAILAFRGLASVTKNRVAEPVVY
jgi:membrane protease YdiL (CAAX protease family)